MIGAGSLEGTMLPLFWINASDAVGDSYVEVLGDDLPPRALVCVAQYARTDVRRGRTAVRR